MTKIELKYNPCNEIWHGERLSFKEHSDGSWRIINDKKIELGKIERVHVGTWMHWCIFLNKDCYLSPGCTDEAREMQRKCYSIHKKPEVENE